MRSPRVIDGRVAVVIASGTKDPRNGRFSENPSLEGGLPISAILKSFTSHISCSSGGCRPAWFPA